MNVWFRHVWYWASPISPATILAVSMAGLALRDVISTGVPLILLLILVPLLVGSISGSPTIGIGIAFPLLLPVIPELNIANVTIIIDSLRSLMRARG